MAPLANLRVSASSQTVLKTFQTTLVVAICASYRVVMQIRVLGAIGVRDGDNEIAIGGPREKSVLAMLLTESDRPVSADRLIYEAWGDGAAAGAMASLYTYVSNLRRSLGRQRVVREAGGYRFVKQVDDQIDVELFEAHLVRAGELARTEPKTTAATLETALALWHGPPFDGAQGTPMLESAAIRLQELRESAEIELFEATLRSGEIPTVSDVEALCGRRNLDERAWAVLMRTLYRSGRHPDALRAFSRFRQLLAQEMGVEPSPQLYRLEEQILLHDSALDPGFGRISLPAYTTTFVGRGDEIAAVAAAVSDHRLVTILGPGGAGKTRLAVEVASSLRSSYTDGVFLIDLASVADPNEIAAAIVASLGLAAVGPVSDLDRAIAWLIPRNTLVILDNCEHLAHSVGPIALALVAQAAGLTIMATSRQLLAVPGEFHINLEGLQVGPSGDSEPGEAEQLFAARAGQQIGNSAMLDAADPAIKSICHRLDGMPLALELAAARAGALSPTEIEALLSRRFAVLVDDDQTRDIHRSLEATVGWSYGLLSPTDRANLSALGIFEGPFSAKAAAAIIEVDTVEAVQVVSRLVAASLVYVQSQKQGRTMYRLLETLKEYARERLVDTGCWEQTQAIHESYYTAMCVRAGDQLYGTGRVAATQEIVAELQEHLAVWDRRISATPARVLAMAWPLGNTWIFQADLRTGEERMCTLVDRTKGDRSLERARALVIGGWILVMRNRMDEAIAWTDEAIDIYRGSLDEIGLAYALARAGHWAFASGAGEKALDLLSESLAICDRIGYRVGEAWPTVLIAQARRWAGDTSPEVRDMFLDARRQFVEIGELYGQVHADMILSSFTEFAVEERHRFATEMVDIAQGEYGQSSSESIAFHSLAYTTWDLGEHQRGERLNRIAIRSAATTNTAMNLGLGLLQAAVFAARLGNSERSALMFGAGHAHFGMMVAPFQQEMFEPAQEQARSILGESRYVELHRIGSAMTTSEAVNFALGRSETPTDIPIPARR